MTNARAAHRGLFYNRSRSSIRCRALNCSSLRADGLSYYNQRIRREQCCRTTCDGRRFSTSTISTILLPPTVYLGLAGTLWFYKCLMMVLFQNKIIYMPSIPPFSRREEIRTYAAGCHPVEWEERRIKSEDDTELALCVGEIPTSESKNSFSRQLVLLYFQGNGASLPPRLSVLSSIIKRLNKEQSEQPIDERIRYMCIALSYRGYWKSKGSPTEQGIELDAKTMLKWIGSYTSNSSRETTLILWGQSLGACVALRALSDHLSVQKTPGALHSVKVKGTILETPFISIREMLVALYPQKWLPYRYLWPFLKSNWDSELALRQLSTLDSGRSIPILMLRAANDEVVPAEQVVSLHSVAQNVGLDVKMRVVPNALHNEATSKYYGQKAVTDFISEATR